MDDQELEQIRKARIEQLKAQAKAGSVETDSGQQAENEMRQSILAQILEPEAADRLGRIRLVNEPHAQNVENRLIALAKSGQLRSKVTEKNLIEILKAVAMTKDKEKIIISRRRVNEIDEIDDL